MAGESTYRNCLKLGLVRAEATHLITQYGHGAISTSRVTAVGVTILNGRHIDTRRPGIAQSVSRRATDWMALVQSLTASRTALGPTQYPIGGAPCGFSLGLKLPEREADHSPPSSTEVKDGGGLPLLHHTSSWRDAYQLSTETTRPFL
jgi:hypothetical protein